MGETVGGKRHTVDGSWDSGFRIQEAVAWVSPPTRDGS
jgi:hypothetical protein